MRSYPVNENPIGSMVSEILRYKQTHILLLYYKDKVMETANLRLTYEFLLSTKYELTYFKTKSNSTSPIPPPPFLHYFYLFWIKEGGGFCSRLGTLLETVH